MKTDTKEVNLKDFEFILNYILDNNKKLTAEGKNPIAVGLEAEAGIGKTSIVEKVAKDRGMTYVKLNLAELDEVGDLTGFPVKEFYIQKDGKGGWVTQETLQAFLDKGYLPSAKTRMSYATPAWLPAANPNGCIINLDDYSRAGNQFMQATMELINTGKFHTWKLPPNTNIVTTSNPDNGKYSVTALDGAQKSRLVNFNLKFDIDVWAKWAESYGMDDRAINFALNNREIFSKKNSNDENVVNARSYVTFCNAISGISNWNSLEGLSMILLISKGCFNDEDNVVGNMFEIFIEQGLDKLITPKEILSGKWETVSNHLHDCIYKDGRYRPEIASILSTRLLNYCCVYFDTKGNKTEPVENRLIDIVESKTPLFTEDMIFNIIKNLVTSYRGRTNKLMMNPKISSRLIR